MTDRYYALTVVLEKDMRDDDAEPIIACIRQLRGVLSVTPHVTDTSQWAADERARSDLGQKLWAVIYPPKEKR